VLWRGQSCSLTWQTTGCGENSDSPGWDLPPLNIWHSIWTCTCFIIYTDMTNYCESLRQMALLVKRCRTTRLPRLHVSDLACQYERAGIIKGKKGLHHPVPHPYHARRRYHSPIPEPVRIYHRGQILHLPRAAQKGIYPPVDIRPLAFPGFMNSGIGKGHTREITEQYRISSMHTMQRAMICAVSLPSSVKKALSERDKIGTGVRR